MRLDLKILWVGLLALLAVTGGCLGISDLEDDATRIGEEDAPLITRHVQIKARGWKRYKVPATPEITAVLQQTGIVPAQLRVTGGASVSGQWEFAAESEVEAEPSVDGIANQDESRVWWVLVYNRGESPLEADLAVYARQAPTPEPTGDGLPTLNDPVQYENDFCVYGDSIPYVRSVKWDNPLVQSAMRAVAPGWRSMFSYGEWRVPYRLESTSANLPDEERMNRQARNYMRVLCGEHRDYPAMLRRKLELITEAQVYAGPNEMQNVDTTRNLFTQITYPAYEKMVETMETVHAYRQGLIRHENDTFHYGHGRMPVYGERFRRVENSVPPWTHCEMKFMFEHYMSDQAPDYVDGATYVAQYEEYKTSCAPEDFESMYNFRGHKNFQPLWLESNGFIMNSQRARAVEMSSGDRTYYLHPFASRYKRAREAWAAYILYRDEDHAKMIQAGDYHGGPILYMTDQDTDSNGISDYRLFDKIGCGDQGVGAGSNPDSNCNMVPWDVAFSTPSSAGAAAGWTPDLWASPDMGFMATITTFEARMARLNAGLDRHTNWGPTSYYQIAASEEGDPAPSWSPMYSPIVACSYDISASNDFASDDYSTTPEFEQGHTKWMYIMRFPTADYYNEVDLRAGRPIDFDKNYFNETSLSNDYYRERALDRFGWVPLADMYANIYFVYGARGEEPPALTDIPAAQ